MTEPNTAIRDRNEGYATEADQREAYFAEQQERVARRRVAFPAAGLGCFFLYKTSALAELEKEHGGGSYDPYVWFHNFENKLLAGSAAALTDAIQIGLHVKDDDGKEVLAFKDETEFPFALTEAAAPILDAVCLMMWDRTHEEQIVYLQELYARQLAEIEPGEEEAI